jgi:D-beta-D-heptose 7-phosphate kinase / D-beta-D-heptose 1-phosphate adenosyltransferase
MPKQPSSISKETLQFLPSTGFSNVTLLVVGDLMLDKYIDGEVHRISPEAPVPVVSVRRERGTAGGAANVALNVTGLNAKVIVAGVIGDDVAGEELRQLLGRAGIADDGIVSDCSRVTTRKTRVICGAHQIVRLDEEAADDVSVPVGHELVQRVTRLASHVDAVILSDYAKGVLSGDLPQRIIQMLNRQGIPVLVDPKRADYTAYCGATCITPNLKEFQHAVERTGTLNKPFTASASLLRDRLKCKYLLVTQGADGMTLVDESSATHLAALAEEVFDVSGAGDTVIATVSTALASGLSMRSAVELANAAASIVVRHIGTTPIRWQDLYELLNQGTGGADTLQDSTVRSHIDRPI